MIKLQELGSVLLLLLLSVGTQEKGYNLPITDSVKEEAAEDCRARMEEIKDIYMEADKGVSLNAVVSGKTQKQMQEILKDTGNPVMISECYAAMEHYQQLEQFLLEAGEGKEGSVLLYKINADGGITRNQFHYDGTNMYVLQARAIWNPAGEATVSDISYTRIDTWEYTENGNFCYELCVPASPEVTEVVDGSTVLRVRPLSQECAALSRACVLSLGYQGNNLLCSNWDAEHMEDLDYNGMYEYLYAMKYGEKFAAEAVGDGVPADEFESVIMEYLPVTVEEIRKWAVYDEEKQTYAVVRLGCANYTPTYFGTSIPEVVDVKRQEDGTMILTVNAVCDKVLCSDAVITHELTVRFDEDGSFQYLGNTILEDGIRYIPEYQYRISIKD